MTPTPTHRRPSHSGAAIFVPKEIEMSKSITEKELAEKLAEAYDDSAHGFRCVEDEADFLRVARRAAELLGVTLTPERPEPGTWHIACSDSDRLPAFVTRQNRLWVFENGMVREDHDPDGQWPSLTPARVVPAEPVELSEAEVGELWNAVNVSRYDWRGYSGMFHEQVTATVNAALVQHGHGRVESDSAAPAITRDQVERAVATQSLANGWTITGITDAVMELLEASK